MVAAVSSPPTPKFKLGQMVATPGAIAALQKSGDDPAKFIERHRIGDWGDMPAEDKTLNDNAIAHEGDRDHQDRVMSSYLTSANEKLWVITEWDRSVTTILLPSEY